MANNSYTGPYYDKWAELYKIGKGQDGKYLAPEKTNEMSDTDYQIGQTLYRAYLENQRLDSDYAKGQQALADNKRNAEISADVTLQRMQKYLPQQLAKQGLYGTGVSEDAYIKLQNQYQQSVSDAAKSHADGMSALESAYQQNKTAVWEQANAGVNAATAQAKTDAANNYTTASEGLTSRTFNSAKDVEDYVESWRGKVSDQDFASLEGEAVSVIKALGFDTEGVTNSNIKNGVDASKIEKIEDASFDDLKAGDDIKVTLNGTPYTVESSGETSAGAAKYAADNGILDGTLFVYGDNKDVYIYSGEVAYKVKSKLGNDKWNAHYNDVRHYLMTGQYGTALSEYNNPTQTEPTKNQKKTTNARSRGL